MRNHWDFIISCFEPIVRVTGGIGTYTRLLLQRLSTLPAAERPSVLFLTTESNRTVDAPQFEGIRFEYIPAEATIDEVPINNLNDPFFHFSLGVMQRLQKLQSEGHTFGTLEVPDYNAEGYYPVKARVYGLLKIDRIVVRLHSPQLMLHEDNGRPSIGTMAHRIFAAERYVYRHADQVLFGGDAMRDRVASLIPASERSAFLAKSLKVPHPWPEFDPSDLKPLSLERKHLHVGYVGRLEYRKGVDLLVRAAVRALDQGTRPVKFHFFGRDTNSWFGASVLAHLRQLIPEKLAPSFIFHDYVPQDELRRKWLPSMDMFVFPSRFENYPNVLLEVLGLGKPTIVSRFGCMPEMSKDTPKVQVCDPLDEMAFATQLASAFEHPVELDDGAQRYYATASAHNLEMERSYKSLFAAKPRRAEPSKTNLPSITFVAPHFNHARWLPEMVASLRSQMRSGDEIIVVDDCSKPEEAEASRAFMEKVGGRFVSTARNSGPSVARNLGAHLAKGDLIYFVDSDDELAPWTVDVFREAFANNPELEVASGFMRVFGDENHFWASYDPQPATILFENSSHCGIVIRREAFERSKGYSEKFRLLIEDWEFNARLTMQGYRFEIIPIVSYRYRVNWSHGRNSKNQAMRQRAYQELVINSLCSVDTKRLQETWPDVAAITAQLLIDNQRLTDVANSPPHLRFRIADTINAMLKLKAPRAHGPLKRAVGWTIARATRLTR